MKAMIVATLFLAPLFLLAQDEPLAVEEELRVRLIELDVRVHDLAGNPITGLTRDDFQIIDKGRKREIDSFEEVAFETLVPELEPTHLPRIMILIDLENMSAANAREVFGQLKEMVRRTPLERTPIGLAINGNGVNLIQDFTTSAPALLDALDRARAIQKKVNNRWAYINNVDGVDVPETDGGNIGQSEYFAMRYRENMQTIRQFVNYLGTYYGNKQLFLVSDVWKNLTASSGNVSVDQLDLVQLQSLQDMKAIQTAGLFGKVTINVINTRYRNDRMAPGTAEDVNRPLNVERTRLNIQGSTNQQSELAALTGGLRYIPSRTRFAEATERMIDATRHFYRIRYYADTDSDRFRPVRVVARGAGRIAHTTSGYFGNGINNRTEDVDFEKLDYGVRSMDIEMETDWMTWQPISLRKFRATAVVGQRAFDENGYLLQEKVTPVSFEKKGKRKSIRFDSRLEFAVPGKRVARIEALIVDMFSGQRVILENNAAPES